MDQDDQQLKQLQNQIQELQFEIEKLQKEGRQTEFKLKSQINELDNELERERKRNEELEKEIQEYIRNYTSVKEIQQFSAELEQRLSETENLLIKSRENEHRMRKELKNLKQERSDCSESHSRIEREDLEQQMKKLEESAIQIIMEKEKLISELREEIQELQDEKSQQERLFMAKMKEQQDQSEALDQEQSNTENSQLKELVSELTHKLEAEQILFEQKLSHVEYEVTERILEGMSHEISVAKNAENDLLQALNNSEEKSRIQERQIHEKEKLISQMKDEHHKECWHLEGKITELTKKLEAALKQLHQNEKKVEDAFRKSSENTKALNKELLKIKKMRDEQLKQLVGEERQVHQLKDDLLHLQQTHDQLIRSKQEREELLEGSLNQYLEKIYELENKLSIQRVEMRQDSCHTEGDEQGQGGGALLYDLEGLEIQESPIRRRSVQKEQSGGGLTNSQENPPTSTSPNNSFELPVRRPLQQLENLQEENKVLRDEVNVWKKENDELQQQCENYEMTIEVLQKEIKSAFMQLQQWRKQNLGMENSEWVKRERELRSELESTKQHLHKIETHFITQKLHNIVEIINLQLHRRQQPSWRASCSDRRRVRTRRRVC